ncbi:hypothetical protein 2050HW_00310 [Serratia phage vB_SmaM_ 2050HW]|uniref:Uncharacterized protein n=1 Tax=Serratia phage vB_SmaM_ 2050HW TaxID=2024252 RepID=A0A289Z7X8_9CAUD|nr:hypothetical protein HWB23_gp310 [Serratia phage vB_SmaM_ 2050HW]ATA65645.1 hypothetical protein 2050HW_00310 [Serratia phage vB_SmaM_ 2050HW]
MSLSDQNVNEAKNTQRAAAAQGQQPREQAGRRLNTNIFESGQLVQAGVSGNELTTFIERFNAYHDANKAALSAGGQLTWAVIPASSGETKMKLDAAVVVGKATTSEGVITTALTLLFTGGQPLPKQVVEISNRNERQYSAVANDQFTEAYQKKLTEIINRKAPYMGEAENIVLMGAVAVTNAQLSEAKCEDLIISAVNSVFGYLGNMLRTEHFSLTDAIDSQRSEFVSRVIYNQGDAHDEITERPRRRDLAVEVSLATKGQRNRVSNALENAEGAMDIATNRRLR